VKIKIRISDVISIIFIAIAVILIIKYVEGGKKNREYLYKNGIETTAIVYDFTHSKSRRFAEYQYEVSGNIYQWSHQISVNDPPVKIGDKIKILYDPKDYSNSTPLLDSEGRIVKVYEIKDKDFDTLMKQLRE